MAVFIVVMVRFLDILVVLAEAAREAVVERLLAIIQWLFGFERKSESTLSRLFVAFAWHESRCVFVEIRVAINHGHLESSQEREQELVRDLVYMINSYQSYAS